jgi:hypothetical protein
MSIVKNVVVVSCNLVLIVIKSDNVGFYYYNWQNYGVLSTIKVFLKFV